MRHLLLVHADGRVHQFLLREDTFIQPTEVIFGKPRPIGNPTKWEYTNDLHSEFLYTFPPPMDGVVLPDGSVAFDYSLDLHKDLFEFRKRLNALGLPKKLMVAYAKQPDRVGNLVGLLEKLL